MPLTQDLHNVLVLFKLYGYFPFQIHPTKGTLSFNFLSIKALYTCTLLVLYICGFLHIFCIGQNFGDLFENEKSSMKVVDYWIFTSEAGLSLLMYLVLSLESLCTGPSFVVFWNELDALVSLTLEPKDTNFRLKKQSNKILIIYACGMSSSVAIVGSSLIGLNKISGASQFSVWYRLMILVWTLLGISYIYMMLYCAVVVYVFVLIFEKNLFIFNKVFGCSNSLKGWHSFEKELEICSVVQNFEKAVSLFSEFQRMFGTKLFLCVSKLCFSALVTFRLLTLASKAATSNSRNTLLGAATLHSAHVWGLIFAVFACIFAQRITGKVLLPCCLSNQSQNQKYRNGSIFSHRHKNAWIP